MKENLSLKRVNNFVLVVVIGLIITCCSTKEKTDGINTLNYKKMTVFENKKSKKIIYLDKHTDKILYEKVCEYNKDSYAIITSNVNTYLLIEKYDSKGKRVSVLQTGIEGTCNTYTFYSPEEKVMVDTGFTYYSQYFHKTRKLKLKFLEGKEVSQYDSLAISLKVANNSVSFDFNFLDPYISTGLDKSLEFEVPNTSNKSIMLSCCVFKRGTNEVSCRPFYHQIDLNKDFKGYPSRYLYK